ncbi:hypothetical protein, partial [Mesorhizobium tianshanense]|uniref:hypothetical protein n=1 Tax=Mesorhizobium tianshanense TaxID=39844 RepID=UPI001ABFA57E
ERSLPDMCAMLEFTAPAAEAESDQIDFPHGLRDICDNRCMRLLTAIGDIAVLDIRLDTAFKFAGGSANS